MFDRKEEVLRNFFITAEKSSWFGAAQVSFSSMDNAFLFSSPSLTKKNPCLGHSLPPTQSFCV